MITILEGPEGGGKSTLAKMLTSHKVCHGRYSEGQNAAQLYLSDLSDYTGAQRVIERSWISEAVHSKPSRLSRWQERMLTRVALAHRTVVVLCLPEYLQCLATWKRRFGKDAHENQTDFENNYRDFVTFRTFYDDLPVVTYNYAKDSISKLVSQLGAIRPLENIGPGVGEWVSDLATLFVGGVGGNYGIEHPFVDINGFGNTVSALITQYLESIGIGEYECYWIKANQNTNVAFMSKLRPRKIVAVGDEASAWCEQFHQAGFSGRICDVSPQDFTEYTTPTEKLCELTNLLTNP